MSDLTADQVKLNPSTDVSGHCTSLRFLRLSWSPSNGHLATIGLAPSHPSTGFGFVWVGEKLSVPEAPIAPLVSSLKEKPDAPTAAAYLATGSYQPERGHLSSPRSRSSALTQRIQTRARRGSEVCRLGCRRSPARQGA